MYIVPAVLFFLGVPAYFYGDLKILAKYTEDKYITTPLVKSKSNDEFLIPKKGGALQNLKKDKRGNISLKLTKKI